MNNLFRPEIRMAVKSEICTIRALALKAFTAAYSKILSKKQTDYMIEMMYSQTSLEKQFDDGHVYFIISENGTDCGYVSVEKQSQNLFHLQKIYLLPEFKGRGYGRILFGAAMDYAAKTAKGAGIISVELNVNRLNPAKVFYEHMGMVEVRSGDFDIGGGFFMNDYIMSISFDTESPPKICDGYYRKP